MQQVLQDPTQYPELQLSADVEAAMHLAHADQVSCGVHIAQGRMRAAQCPVSLTDVVSARCSADTRPPAHRMAFAA